MNTKLIALGVGAALTLASAAILPSAAHADLNIFACEPEWASLAKEIGGDKVTIYTTSRRGRA
jgi:zinc/manganese transport system substrate-binding protein